ncbi:MAG: BrnA antitoxin family protein [Actinomycetia bacterium]|nr:BrnA antitoxin family protein [Actinomycetes bacterium]
MRDGIEKLRDYYDNTDTSDALERATLERPDVTAEPMVTYALRLPKPVLDGLRQSAESRGTRVSTLMRTWLEERIAMEAAGQDRIIAVDEILALLAERGRPRGGAGAA